MELSNLLVEVRTASLQKVGAILPDDLRLDAQINHNGVGSWTCLIARSHPLASALMSPGGGLVVTDLETSNVVFSGPANMPEDAQTVEDLGGTVTVTGITDETFLADMLAWPDPASGDLDAQEFDADTRSGPAETLMHEFVNANIGPGAVPERRNARITMGENLERGTYVTKSARFDNLLVLLQSLAAADSLGFRVVQVGDELEFQTTAAVNQGRSVRLSVESGGLTSARFARTAPGLTRAIVGGQGGNTARLFYEGTTEESLQAEIDWGRRIERFFDEQSTRMYDELVRVGAEALAAEGSTVNNAQFEPAESLRASFGRDWFLGDIVSVESHDQEYVAPVAAAIIKIDSDGLRIGALLGDGKFYADESTKLAAAMQAAQGAAKADAAFDPTPLLEAEERAAVDAQTKATAARVAAIAVAADDATAKANAARDEAITAAAADVDEKLSTFEGAGGTTITHSVDTPGTAANSAGDVWFQYNAEDEIIGQWEGLGGTSWKQVTISGEVIATLDAGKLTAGSAFTVDLGVKSTLTLGDATEDGVIETHDFDAATQGVRLSKSGLVAKGAELIGSTLKTAASGKRWEIIGSEAGSGANTIRGYSNNAYEFSPATIRVDVDGSNGAGISMAGPQLDASQATPVPELALYMFRNSESSYDTRAVLDAEETDLYGGLRTYGRIIANLYDSALTEPHEFNGNVELNDNLWIGGTTSLTGRATLAGGITLTGAATSTFAGQVTFNGGAIFTQPVTIPSTTGAGKVGPYEWDSAQKWVATPATQLTPTMSVASHALYVKEVAPGVVVMSGYLDVDDNNTTRRDTGMRIPVGLRPLAETILAAPQYGGGGQYRFIIGTDGMVEFQQTVGPNGPFEAISGAWFTA